MSDKADNLVQNLKLFGFDEEEATVYLKLVEKRSASVLKLSKELPISRTKLYRILERLMTKGFVKQEIKEYGTKYCAESYEKLNLLIQDAESKAEELKSQAPMLFNQLAKLQMNTAGESKILHYRGIEGLKQVTWNSTKVQGNFRIYEVDLLHSVVDHNFAEKARKEFGKNQHNKFYQLTNAVELPEYTDVSEHIRQWQVRHIPKEELEIKFEIQIYNDVCCMFEYTEEDIFIVEIYNQHLAEMQKQLFDLVWKYARPMEKVGERGYARL